MEMISPKYAGLDRLRIFDRTAAITGLSVSHPNEIAGLKCDTEGPVMTSRGNQD